jgi:F0F1-type ATP synthase membrane subunit b/b'
MLVFALSPGAAYTIAAIAVWFVIFPAFVTGLIVFAIAGALRERTENVEAQARRRRA